MSPRVLTPEERARLRPTVNIVALERLLNRLGPGDRMQVIWACHRDPEALVVGLSEEQAELMSKPPGIARPSLLTSVGGRLRFADPDLQTLWTLVEPSDEGAA